MKQKLFYPCILEALYMMKNFGVKLEVEIDGEFYDFEEMGVCDETIKDFLKSLKNYPERVYVKEGSEAIFKIAHDDLISGDLNGEEIFGKLWQLLEDLQRTTCLTNRKILMRNQMHFFQPQSYEAK